jgi:hypothetical protein
MTERLNRSQVAACFSFSLAAVLVFGLCMPPAQAAESGANKRPILQAPSTDSVPVLDGKLDDPCWEQAAKTAPLKVIRGQASGANTRVFLLRDADHLYVGVKCDCANAKREVGKESLELLIDSNGDGNSYYLIGITDGKKGFTSSYNEQDPHWIDVTWRPAFTFATAGADKGWAAEFKLPFVIFSKNKEVATEIGFDLKRSGMAGNETHGWHGGFSNVARSGILKGIPALSNVPSPEYSTAAIPGGRRRFVRPLNKAGRDFLVKEKTRTIQLGPGSSHPCTTGEVRLELEKMLMAGSPHARGIIWDLAVDKDKGELYVLSDTRLVRGVAELRVFDRKGQYLRTIMPVNPTLPGSKVEDICRKTAREGGVDLVIPKHFLAWGEPSMYGDWWHHPEKLVLAPDGDLIMANLYQGILWRLKPDGSFPAEGWTSAYNSKRNEPFESTVWTKNMWQCYGLKNHLPFRALHYPYFCFGKDGLLYMSAGQSSRPTIRYAYHYEVFEGRGHVYYQWPVDGNRGGAVWKCGLKPGPKIERIAVFSGFAEPSGIVAEGNHLVVADAGHDRLQVLDGEGKPVASITYYEHEGQKKPLHAPTALAIDRDKSLYVLIGSENRQKESARNHGLPVHRPPAAKAPAELPRRVIKLRSWKKPELLAASGPLHPHTMQIAVDSGVKPPLVWVANAAGPGSLQQLSGADLSRQAAWQDDGETLSNPRQSGDQPILNIDPETGHLYVEDDSNYRLKQYGTVYRVDQQGKVLKKWEPLFFDALDLKILSPWGVVDSNRHFRYPAEPLFIDSIFGKDGRVYRWKLDKTGISLLRFDRAGKPVPFKSTGTNTLFTERAMKFTFWWDVYNGVDVDEQGNIYYVARVDPGGKVDAYSAMHRQINVYDASGKLKRKSLLVLDTVKGIQVDVKGNLYALHRPFERPWEDYLAISKFAPSGGKPLWTRRWDGNPGWAQLANPPCQCSTTRFHQTLDGKGYLYTAGKYSIQVIKCETGELVGEFGSYGNVDCKGKGSRFPHPELPFGGISGLVVWKDRLFVLDEVNRRIVKCRIIYGKGKGHE